MLAEPLEDVDTQCAAARLSGGLFRSVPLIGFCGAHGPSSLLRLSEFRIQVADEEGVKHLA